ncbi:hypothetical protein BH18THE2_BH18THE2_36660 [soil metagenome]
MIVIRDTGAEYPELELNSVFDYNFCYFQLHPTIRIRK